MKNPQIIILSIVLVALLAACAPPPAPENAPDLAAARRACAGLPDPEREQCIVDRAAQALNPEVCRLLSIAVDDMCLQVVFEAAADPAICDRLYLEGIRPTCRAYYADPQRLPRLLTPTPMPATAGLGTVAYVQGGDIWLKRLPDDEPQRVTDDGVDGEPLWSPSGRWLAFRKLDSQLWLYSLETGAARVVDQAAPVNDFHWSPAADTIAYVVGSGVLHLRMMAAGSSESTVLTPPSPSASPGWFAWSPDGNWLAYVWTGPDADDEYRQEIRLQAAAGGDPVTLFSGGNPVTEPTLGLAGWLPSGKGLLIWFGSRLVDSFLPEAVDLLVLPVDRGWPFAGELTPHAPDASWWHIGDLSPAPVGSAWGTKDALAVVVGDGPTWTGKRLQVAGTPVTPPDQVAIQPAWSPDGKELAYSAMPDPGAVTLDQAGQAVRGRHIWVASTSGDAWSVGRYLTDNPSYRDEHPRWSADGSYLLFARLDEANRVSLWLIPARGGQPLLVVEDVDLVGPSDEFKVQIEWEKNYDWFMIGSGSVVVARQPASGLHDGQPSPGSPAPDKVLPLQTTGNSSPCFLPLSWQPKSPVINPSKKPATLSSGCTHR
jgi:Tol biopolymer transport system component